MKNALGGGTWEPYGEGSVLIGKAASGTFNTIGKTGGEETHQLTQSELPRVTGTIDLHSGGSGTNLVNGTGVFSLSDQATNWYRDGGNRSSGGLL